MNADLLENAVKFHGKKLFNLILKQNNCGPIEAETKKDEDNFHRHGKNV